MAAAKPSSVVGWPVVTPTGRMICDVARNDEGESNAKLIAAAPQMLETLRLADKAMNPPDRDGISLHEWSGRLKEATAKIRFLLEQH